MGTLLRRLLRPATALFMRSGNAFKLPLIAATFTSSVAVAAWAQPFAWSSVPGALVAALWLAGIYLCAAFHVGSEEARAELRAATVLNRRDLRELVEQARAGAMAARDTADALARGNARLSARSEGEAATLEQSAASLARLEASARDNAESCREASDVAADATRQARGGSEAARSAVATMDRIEESSRRIADIVGVIESIAFQTNILALNAAVEAARAGEEGRGFAVVASEVRALAQRCADAAREVRGLVSGAMEGVGAGSRQVREAGRIIGDVTAAVESVNELLGVIALASREQAGEAGAVSRAVAQLQSMAGENAQAVRGSARAAASLEGEARRVLEVVDRFKLQGDEGPE